TQAIFEGKALKDILESALLGTVSGCVGTLGASHIGALVHPSDGSASALDPITHKVLHAAVGAASAAIARKDIAAGALGAAVGESVGEICRDALMEDVEKGTRTYEEVMELSVGISGIVCAMAASLLDLDADTAANAAGNAVERNVFWMPVCMALGATAEGAAAIAAGSGALIEATILVLNAAGLTYIAHDVHEAYQRGGFEAAKDVLAQHAGLYLSTRGAYGVGLGAQRSLILCEEAFVSFGRKMAAFGRGEIALPNVIAKAESLLAKIESAMPRMGAPLPGRGAQAPALHGAPGPRAANQNAPNAPTPRAQPASSSSATQAPVCVNDMRAPLPDRPIESFYYSNCFSARLPVEDLAKRRYRHNQIGNEQLHRAFQLDPIYAARMEVLYPGIVRGVKPGPKGAFPRTAPTGDLTWHHDAYNMEILTLISKAHHEAKGIVQLNLHPHPNGGGGYYLISKMGEE
ncbi:MAG: DUF637 domain-containing protein, partial [Proteobacteria bacterium]|nr:DUF637 domain-containing protein [Pseudomonadota bacterium]